MNSPRSILPLPARTPVKPVPSAISSRTLAGVNRFRGQQGNAARREIFFAMQEVQNALHADRTRVGCADRRAN